MVCLTDPQIGRMDQCAALHKSHTLGGAQSAFTARGWLAVLANPPGGAQRALFHASGGGNQPYAVKLPLLFIFDHCTEGGFAVVSAYLCDFEFVIGPK
jgi:hypothetical protein